jgi:methylmalonyl-CoA/ethylmalonyl-CoA epimerase
MKVDRVDHISVAVRDIRTARRLWEPVLGKAEPDDSYVDEREKIRVVRYLLADVAFELMESIDADGAVAKWIDEHGEGVMVVSFRVDDTGEAIEELESRDYPFISDPNGEKARPFRDGHFAFIHPKKLNGVLLELIDCKETGSTGHSR